MENAAKNARPVGPLVPDFTPPSRPLGEAMHGEYSELVALDAEAHGDALFAAYEGHDEVWDYLFTGPYATVSDFKCWVEQATGTPEQIFYAIRNLETGAWEGLASYLRINPESGSIEVGNINYSPALQRTRAGTEAMFLMMQWAFDAGYRRYEWKCNALNHPSRVSAQRLGFSFEGVFRQMMIVKGRNRDTAWFAMVDSEWPRLRAAYTAWLSPENFDAAGQQRQSLSALTAPIRVASDPTL